MKRNRPGTSKRRREHRKRLMIKQNGMCFYCDSPMLEAESAGANDPQTATFDHVIPVSEGGSNGFANIVLACFDCNQKKGKLHAHHFIDQKDGSDGG